MPERITTCGDTAITLFGAAGEVTGSCSLLETGGTRILVDFGLFQGDRRSERRNLEVPDLDFASLDAVVVGSGTLRILRGSAARGVLSSNEQVR